MASKYGVELISGIAPKNGGNFPLVHAKDVEMNDGSRLSEMSPTYPIKEGASTISPDIYYVFGEVESLSVDLLPVDDGKIHEYCFEFIPKEDLSEITITPAPRWINEPLFQAGKTHQVSIVRGIGVIVSA